METILKPLYNLIYKLRPPESVSYWRTKEAARARVLRDPKDGAIKMEIEGEKYLYPGFPRAHILFSSVASIKHKAKNLIFNEVWAMLEAGKSQEEISEYVHKVALPDLLAEVRQAENDMVPPSRMNVAVREIWRAFEEVELTIKDYDKRNKIGLIKKAVCLILTEDDAYRFRVQLLSKYVKWAKYLSFEMVKKLAYTLENMEVVIDMKLRAKLTGRVLLALMEDKEISELANKVLRATRFKKLKMTKADLYYARGKYLKCDYGKFDY